MDGGRFAAKRIVGDSVVVEADAFADGHDVVVVRLRHRPLGDTAWIELPMEELGNDRWRASFRVDALGRHAYTVAAWSGTLELDTDDLWLDPRRVIEVEDLLDGGVERLDGNRLAIVVDPARTPARVLHIRGQA